MVAFLLNSDSLLHALPVLSLAKDVHARFSWLLDSDCEVRIADASPTVGNEVLVTVEGHCYGDQKRRP